MCRRKKEEQKADPNKKVEITYWDFPQFTKDKEFTKTEDFDEMCIRDSLSTQPANATLIIDEAICKKIIKKLI